MKLKFWDKVEDIYTLGRDSKTGKSHFTADEWADRYPWIKIPGAKMIINEGNINALVTMEFYGAKEQYKKMGANITDDMTDDEVLLAIEDFENNPPVSNEISSEERIAAALEAQVMMNEPNAVQTYSDIMGDSAENAVKSKAFDRIKKNYDNGLWGASLLQLSVEKGRITMDEMAAILEE